MTIASDHIDFYLVGIGNSPKPKVSIDIQNLIDKHNIFSGGKRHYDLVKDLLPKDHNWIEISGSMTELIDKYQSFEESILIFASGDPLFYGFGNTLKRLLPNARLKTFPYFNSIQLLCHRTQTNYNDLKVTSVHGRDWSALYQALIKDEPLIGVLTDQHKNPATIAKKMIQYGFDHYEMLVGENLEGLTEKIVTGSLQDLSKLDFSALNCVLLKRKQPKARSFGLNDHDFIPLDGRPNMITKMAVRLNTLQACELSEAKVFWDIGSCTGSVAIEAKRHYPHLQITAIEKRKVCGGIIQSNMERFSTPGIDIVIDDFFNLDMRQLTIPDVVFIGGHGNRLAEMIRLIYNLNNETKFVTNAVLSSTSQVFKDTLSSINRSIRSSKLKIDDHNEIEILSA
ncbi:precorrin-6y C5,15-methyltransferase (decarboxylating) subunit CbiE [Reichenbachiella versicolor]|uniref:precorrin-6y C5,15-methyltransferase (decarboxylating) subunit CbiE n=1 Tax=Reichenbachiella versicolor TaxID=1821036 RepID=UPI000D6E0435|nr:precorrin-6y C5,15-methyltransferase (decarboxylating) subunit CbiE [Reichenbachiella versicolor]